MKHQGIGRLLIVALACIALAACGGADEPPQAPATRAKEKAPSSKVQIEDGANGCDTCIPLPPHGHP